MELTTEECIKIEQVKFVCQEDEQIVIFDRDNWNSNNVIESEKQIFQDNGIKQLSIVQKLQAGIQESKQNLFKVQFTAKNNLKKLPPITQTNKSQKQALNAILQNPFNILKQGFIEKKTDGFIFKWNTRFMVLTSQKLLSFENQKKQKITGCVNLKLLPCKLNTKGQKIILDFQNQCQNIVLKLENQKEAKQWRHWLDIVIQYQSRSNKILLNTINKPIYDFKNTLAQEQFRRFTQTGDILLFHTNHTGAKIQRVVTNSDYDHVAMVIKFHRQQLLVFQCNPIDGVTIYEWKMFIKYFNLYKQVTLRKLYSVKRQDLNHSFLHFAKKNVGKKFVINPIKLLRNQTDFDWQSAKDVDRGYFCSQLIAKAYKSVGLLDPKKSSAKYWPVDFSEKGQIKLLNGATLGSEQVVILNKHLKKLL